MFRISRGPKTKSIMMFTGKNHPFEAGIFKGVNPLVGIKRSGLKIEDFSSPYPHSFPVKVFKEKCTNAFISMPCHAN
jgi:hypothetical protein